MKKEDIKVAKKLVFLWSVLENYELGMNVRKIAALEKEEIYRKFGNSDSITSLAQEMFYSSTKEQLQSYIDEGYHIEL
jgi:hypothetical protein